MINYKLVPAHLLRLYTWEVLSSNAGIEKINNLIPIVPIIDEGQFADANKPYLIYGFSEQLARGPVSRGIVSFRVISNSLNEIVSLVNLIQRVYEEEDSQDRLNQWTTDAGHLGIRFTSLNVSYVEMGEAPVSQGGRAEGIINISYEYVSRYNVKVYDVNNKNWEATTV